MTTLNQGVYGNIQRLNATAHNTINETATPAGILPIFVATQVLTNTVPLQRITTTPNTQWGYRATC